MVPRMKNFQRWLEKLKQGYYELVERVLWRKSRLAVN